MKSNKASFVNKCAANIFKDYLKGKNINYEEFDCVTLDEMEGHFYTEMPQSSFFVNTCLI